MKNILKISLIISCIFFFNVDCILSQSNEQKIIPAEGGKYISCGSDQEGKSCGNWLFLPDFLLVDSNFQPSPIAIKKLCAPRSYRQLIVYDDELLQYYTHDSLVRLFVKAQSYFINALDSSGLDRQFGARLIAVMPWKMPTYTTLFELISPLSNFTKEEIDTLLTFKNNYYDADHLILISRSLPVSAGKGINSLFVNNTSAPLETIYEKSWKNNTGIVNFLTIVPNGQVAPPTTTFAHECSHSLGCAHENSNFPFYYTNAYVNDEKGVNCLTKGARVESFTRNRFSGPKSLAFKSGETIVMGSDSVNNARHVQECLELIWCATENHVTRVSLPTTTCANGKLQAITNNADTFQWKVLSGDCSINGTGQEISYMATSQSKIQVIAQKKGKWYWDTAIWEIPALQHTTLSSSIKQGEFFILPNKDTVYNSGSYTVTLKNQNGCDSLITINLSVISFTNNIDQEQIIILPNPVHEFLLITNLNEYSHGCIISCSGIKRDVDLSQDEIDVLDLLPGTYIIQLMKGNQILQKKFIKL